MYKIFNELGLDADGNGMISKGEFEKIIENKEIAKCIQDMGVDVCKMIDMVDIFFEQEGEVDINNVDGQYGPSTVELSLEEFMECIIQLRGSNYATVKDLMNMQQILKTTIEKHSRAVLLSNSRLSQASRSGASQFRPTLNRQVRSTWRGDIR